jgi:hypothetical protein
MIRQGYLDLAFLGKRKLSALRPEEIQPSTNLALIGARDFLLGSFAKEPPLSDISGCEERTFLTAA